MRCLANAIAFIHRQGISHTDIRPSNISIDDQNHIAFIDVGSLHTFQRDRKINRNEVYDYAAPESKVSNKPIVGSDDSQSGDPSGIKNSQLGSSTSSLSTGFSDASTVCSEGGRATERSPSSSLRSCSASALTEDFTATSTPLWPFCPSESIVAYHIPGRQIPPSLSSPASTLDTIAIPEPTGYVTVHDHSTAESWMSDIYSLGCVYLEILTFMIEGKTTNFARFRSQSQIPRSSGSRPTSRKFWQRTRTAPSFHAAGSETIHAWIEILQIRSAKRPEDVFRAVPELLRLCKSMMAQNAALRPTARQVRDMLHDITKDTGSMKTLCCAVPD